MDPKIIDRAVQDSNTSWEEIEHDDAVISLPDGTQVDVGLEDCGGDGHSYWAVFWVGHTDGVEFFRKDGYHDPGLTEYHDGLTPVKVTDAHSTFWKDK